MTTDNIEKEVKFTRIFQCNKDSKALVLVNVGGRRSSKSYSILQLIIHILLTEQHKVIGICRKTFPALRMSTMKDFFQMLTDYGMYNVAWHNKTFNTYEYNTNTVQLFGLDDSSKARSTGFSYVFMEEANEFDYDDYIVLKTSLSVPCKEGERNHLYMALNPCDDNNFIAQKVIKEEDVEVIKSTYKDNPTLSEAYKKALEDLVNYDEYSYRVYALGEWGRLEGKIYQNYKVIPALPDMSGAKWAYGLDYGLVNPSALVKVWLLNGQFYWEQKLYKEGLTVQDIIEHLTHEDRGDIYADPSAKMNNQEVRNAGWIVHDGTKEVKGGINLCQRNQLYLPSDSVDLIKEIGSYHWRKDPLDKTRFLDEPVKRDDHGLDSCRYATVGLIERYGNATAKPGGNQTIKTLEEPFNLYDILRRGR